MNQKHALCKSQQQNLSDDDLFKAQSPGFLDYQVIDSDRSRVPDTKWYYVGQDGNIYGPNSATAMFEWYQARYFPENVLLRTENDESFYKLSEWISNCGNQIPFMMNIASMSSLTGDESMIGAELSGLRVNGGGGAGRSSSSSNAESPTAIASQQLQQQQQQQFVGPQQLAGGYSVMSSAPPMFPLQMQPFVYSSHSFLPQQQQHQQLGGPQATLFTTSAAAQPFAIQPAAGRVPQCVMIHGFPPHYTATALQQSAVLPPPSYMFNACGPVPEAEDMREMAEENNRREFTSVTDGNTIHEDGADDLMGAGNARAATANTQWYYIGLDCKTYGPNSATAMFEWYQARYFPENVLLRTENDESFYKLSDWISNCGNQIPFMMNIVSMSALTGEGSMNGFTPPGLSLNRDARGGKTSPSPTAESPSLPNAQQQLAGGCFVMPSVTAAFPLQGSFAYSGCSFLPHQQLHSQAAPFTSSAPAQQPCISPPAAASGNGPQFVVLPGFAPPHPGAAIAMIPQ